jgi:hypothetical protein
MRDGAIPVPWHYPRNVSLFTQPQENRSLRQILLPERQWAVIWEALAQATLYNRIKHAADLKTVSFIQQTSNSMLRQNSPPLTIAPPSISPS